MGRAVIVQRGDCLFIDKVKTLQDAGAAVVIIVDDRYSSKLVSATLVRFFFLFRKYISKAHFDKRCHRSFFFPFLFLFSVVCMCVPHNCYFGQRGPVC